MFFDRFYVHSPREFRKILHRRKRKRRARMEKKHPLFEGSQISPARPSGRSTIKSKTLGW